MLSPESPALELVASLDPRQIMTRLVQLAVETVDADRCTLTSVDQDVMRVEASHQDGGVPEWVGHEYPFSALADQPLLAEAIETGSIVVGGGFERGTVAPELARDVVPIKRTAIVPLPIGDNVGAVLILSRREDRPFLVEELGPLQQIGMIAVLALRNARLLQAVQQAQDRGLRALTLVSQQFAASDELPEFFGRMSESVAGLVGAAKAAFWVLEGDALVARPRAFGFDDQSMQAMRVELTQSDDPLNRLLEGGEVLGGRIPPEALEGQYGAALKAMGMRDVIAVPWRTAAQPLGLLMAADSERGFVEQDEWVLRLAARASALVWQGYEAERRATELQADERHRLADHAERIARLETQKSDFLRLASHELRTPITLIRGYLSLFEEGAFGEMSEAARAVLPVMTARLNQINLLVDQMLNAARLEDGRLIIEAQDISLDELVHRVVGSLDGLRRSGHKVIVESDVAEVRAHADPDKVESIVANLLSNALKYSPHGGEVRLQLRRAGAFAELAVTDHGLGIRDDDLPRLFGRFTRLERPETVSIEGTGLGLYLSRELARMQGGDIEVASLLDQGSTFTLRLPGARLS